MRRREEKGGIGIIGGIKIGIVIFGIIFFSGLWNVPHPATLRDSGVGITLGAASCNSACVCWHQHAIGQPQ